RWRSTHPRAAFDRADAGIPVRATGYRARTEAFARLRATCAAGRPVRHRSVPYYTRLIGEAAARAYPASRPRRARAAAPVSKRRSRVASSHGQSAEPKIEEPRPHRSMSHDHTAGPRLSAHREALSYRLMVESVRDYAIFMLDPRGIVMSWNEGAAAITGYTPDEIIGSHFSRFYPKEAIERGWPAHELSRAAADGRIEDENWRVRKDGSLFWANVVITAMRAPDGTLLGFSKITRDLTDKRRAEQALARSEERFRLLVEGVRDYAIFMLDRNGFVTSWNAGAERISGWTSTQILGKHFSHFYSSEDIALHKPWKQIAEARESGRVTDEGWRARNDGSLFWAGSVMTALHDDEGRPYGFAHVMQDLTTRRHAEALADRAQRTHEF